MSWKNDNIPEIDLECNLDKRSFAAIAAMLDKNGFGSTGAELLEMAANVNDQAQGAVDSVANDTVKEVTDLIKERQYHSKSGYGPGSRSFDRKVGNQHLANSVKDYREKSKHRILANITNGGYNYSQAFEFGLLSRDYPAHHPFEDAARHLGLDQLNGEFDREVDEAIRRGIN